MNKLTKNNNVLLIIMIIFVAVVFNCLEKRWTVGRNKQSAQTEQEKSNKINALVVPNLNDPNMIMVGAGQFDAHCIGCHSMTKIGGLDENRVSLKYLDVGTRYPISPKDEYRVIRYGRSFEMPKFVDHDNDYSTWSTIAFIRKASELTPQQYHSLVTRAPRDRVGLIKD